MSGKRKKSRAFLVLNIIFSLILLIGILPFFFDYKYFEFLLYMHRGDYDLRDDPQVGVKYAGISLIVFALICIFFNVKVKREIKNKSNVGRTDSSD